MPQPERFEILVLGSGAAGKLLSWHMAQSGRRTAAVERQWIGGSCPNVACLPSKNEITSAKVAHVARHAAEYGVHVSGDVTVDLADVKARKDRIIGQSRTGVEKWLRTAQDVSVFTGHARFIGPHRISIADHEGHIVDELSADEFFLNTGTRPVIPQIDGLERIRYFTNSSLLDLTELPEHLVIVGASYIALEFAQVFRRFGSRVTVLARGERVLSREDADFSDAVQKVLAREGIEFRFNSAPVRIEPLNGDGSTAARVSCASGIPVEGSHLLFATGRRPNTDDLGLDAAGVHVDAHGTIPVDGQLRTNVPGIWAIGDVNGRGAFTHTSYDDFQVVAANLLDNGKRSVDDRIMAYAVFVDPPLAHVGLSETEVRESGRAALISTMPMTRVGRARERSETDGFMKVLVDAQTKQILGATILGIEGDEAIHTIIDIMTARAPYPTLQYAVHIHPTISELVPTLLDGLKPLE